MTAAVPAMGAEAVKQPLGRRPFNTDPSGPVQEGSSFRMLEKSAKRNPL